MAKVPFLSGYRNVPALRYQIYISHNCGSHQTQLSGNSAGLRQAQSVLFPIPAGIVIEIYPLAVDSKSLSYD
jgi:hypothetical protein